MSGLPTFQPCGFPVSGCSGRGAGVCGGPAIARSVESRAPRRAGHQARREPLSTTFLPLTKLPVAGVPEAYPAFCDAELVVALRRRLPQAASGVVLTSDLFYPSPVLGSQLEMWQRAGCAAVEMELSALLVTAAQHGAQAAGVFAVDGN